MRTAPTPGELHDQVLRLDRWLGRFMDSLAVLVPAEGDRVGSTGDHGVTALPEVAAGRGQTAGRVWLGDLLREVVQLTENLPSILKRASVYGNVAQLRSRGVNVDSLATALAAKAAAVPGVARVYTPKTLRSAPASDTAAVLWRRTIPDDFGWLLCATVPPGFVWSARTIGEHGTTNIDDQWVPVAFLGPGFVRQHFVQPVSTTDIGPTLAQRVGVRPTERIDGHVLTQALGRAAR